MFDRILVPTDFSPSATEALRIAREGFPEADISLLHVLEPKRVAGALSSPVNAADDRKALEAEAVVRHAPLPVLIAHEPKPT